MPYRGIYKDRLKTRRSYLAVAMSNPGSIQTASEANMRRGISETWYLDKSMEFGNPKSLRGAIWGHIR
jgi:hypothetical protein